MALFCALLTRLEGMPVSLSPNHKAVLVHPSAWVGISFVFLVMFVLVFTNARARGVKSLVLFLVLVVLGLIVQLTAGWTEILQFFPLLLVHMNLAFYLLFSGVLLAAWLFVVLGTDHSVYWEFGPNSIAKKYRFTGAAESYHVAPGRDLAPERRHLRAPAAGAVVPRVRHRRHRDPLQHRRQRPEGHLPEERLACRLRRERDQSPRGLRRPSGPDRFVSTRTAVIPALVAGMQLHLSAQSVSSPEPLPSR